MKRKPAPIDGEPGSYTLPPGYGWQGTVSVESREGDMLQLKFNASVKEGDIEFFIYDLTPCSIAQWRKLWTTDWTKKTLAARLPSPPGRPGAGKGGAE